jgi:hypothetical protein
MRSTHLTPLLLLAGLVLPSAAIPAADLPPHIVLDPEVRQAVPPIHDTVVEPVLKWEAHPRVDTNYAIGDEVVVGTTRYDYQHNGSHGKMIAVSADGVSHGSFMGGANVGAGRRVLAWCVDPDLSLTPAMNVMLGRAGFTTHATTSAAPVNGLPSESGVAGYHTTTGAWFGVDFWGCTLAFDLVPETESADILWPHIALDYRDKLHMVCSNSGTVIPNGVHYTASTNGQSWDGPYVLVTDDSNTISAVPVAAKHAPGAAVLFMERTAAAPDVYEDQFYGAKQWCHDILCYETRGATNNLFTRIAQGNPVNLTRFWDPTSPAPFRTTVGAFTDMDAIYDSQQTPDLHVAFTAPVARVDSLQWVTLDDNVAHSLPFIDLSYRSALFHINASTGEWGHIGGWLAADHEGEEIPYVFAGVFRVKEDRVQLAHDPDTGHLYALWNVYDLADRRSPGTDGKAMANGELYMACSADNGRTWGPRINITNTPSPGCLAPDCLSETYATLAETVSGGCLHVTFLQDRHAGASIRDTDINDGSLETENDVYYLRIPIGEIPPPAGEAWDAAGHIGLSRYNSHRTVLWTYGSLNNVLNWDRVEILNEGWQPRHLDRLSFYHDPLDPFDSAGLWVTWQVKPGDLLADNEWITEPADGGDWDGLLPVMDALQVKLGIGHVDYPLREQAFRFEFDDGTVRTYRYQYYGLDGNGSLVELIDLDNLDQYASRVLYERQAGLPVCQVHPGLLDFGQLETGEVVEQSFVITNAGGGRLQGEVEAACPGVTILDGMLDLGAEESQTVTVRVEGLAPGGLVCELALPGPCPAVVVQAVVTQTVAAEESPAAFGLTAIRPNPFNPTTTIDFSLPETRHVLLRVYDTQGRLVGKLVDRLVERGSHQVVFDAASLPSGIYIAHLQAGEFQEARTLLLVK